jgi:hypothetical protein
MNEVNSRGKEEVPRAMSLTDWLKFLTVILGVVAAASQIPGCNLRISYDPPAEAAMVDLSKEISENEREASKLYRE